jgi:hypothetical protein
MEAKDARCQKTANRGTENAHQQVHEEAMIATGDFLSQPSGDDAN